MDPDEQVRTLVEKSVLTETSGSEELQLTDEFGQLVSRRERELTDEETTPRALLEGTVAPRDMDAVLSIVEDDPSFAPHLSALGSALGRPVSGEWFQLIPFLEQLRRELTPSHGAPSAFQPVDGDLLPTLLRFHEFAVVYVWLSDCSPCDVMRRDLDEVFPGGENTADVALFSVFGPASKETLSEHYDVEGGPATLFVRNGDVDSRLYGAHHPRVIEREVEVLQRSET